MFDESNESFADRPFDPAERARSKFNELRMHAELAAVFEGPRKFDAPLDTGLSAETARAVQRTIGLLEKSKPADTTLIPPASTAQAAELLNQPALSKLATSTYHIYRRPGEAMIVRWLQGKEVDTFYERLQAHFDAALQGAREDERQANEWKQDQRVLDYLKALDSIDMQMSDLYRRNAIRQHGIYVLSTVTADEINISFLTDHLMGVTPADVVGETSAPEDSTDERSLAWFFKLFVLRGVHAGEEQICFFTYLQKTEDEFNFD